MIKYYDEALVNKIKRWIPDNADIKVLSPEDTTELFNILFDENRDAQISLPLIALSRDPQFSLLAKSKNQLSYNGPKINMFNDSVEQFNAIPITLSYQLDIYTRNQEDADNYLYNFLFKLINNPLVEVEIPSDNTGNCEIQRAKINLNSDVQDNSDIPLRLVRDQIKRWTITFTLDDAYLYHITNNKPVTIGNVILSKSKDRNEDEIV